MDNRGPRPDGSFDSIVVWPIGAVWEGKVFDAAQGAVVNRLAGRHMVHGTVTDTPDGFVIRYPLLPGLHDALRWLSPSTISGELRAGARVLVRFRLERTR
jgi:hypothetical protein